MAKSIYANLAPLIRTSSVPITQFLVSAVARDELDLIQMQKDLESENIEWSNKKIDRVTSAIKSLIQNYTAASVETRETFKEDLGKKCLSTKQS